MTRLEMEKQLQNASNILIDLMDIEKKYQNTLKLEEINKIHDNLDKKNIEIFEILLEIINFMADQISLSRISYGQISQVGMITSRLKNNPFPSNSSWIPCDGREVDCEKYPRLCEIIIGDIPEEGFKFKVPHFKSTVFDYFIFAK